MKGIISLHKRNGEQADLKYYSSKRNRKDIIWTWQRLYAKGIDSCHFIITPFAEPDLVDENGFNKKPEMNIQHKALKK